MKVSILIAASGRPDLFKDMLISLKKTVNMLQDMETVFIIDSDLPSFQYATDFPTYSGQIIDYSPERRGALWAWNRALQLSTGDILVPAGDDQLFHDGWLDYALESHREKLGGYGVTGMNDLAYNGNTQVATMFIFDRQYCKDHMGGIFAPPCYNYYNIDSEWNEKAKMLGRFYWDERAKVEHLHSAHGKRPVDRHDLDRQAKDYMETDRIVFEERKANNFPVTWSPII